MVKIVRAHNTPAVPELNIESGLFVEIEIEGFKKGLGGLPVEWGKKEIANYIKREYPRIMREVALEAEEERKTHPELRQDLINRELEI